MTVVDDAAFFLFMFFLTHGVADRGNLFMH